jgi:hypothetical protein
VANIMQGDLSDGVKAEAAPTPKPAESPTPARATEGPGAGWTLEHLVDHVCSLAISYSKNNIPERKTELNVYRSELLWRIDTEKARVTASKNDESLMRPMSDPLQVTGGWKVVDGVQPPGTFSGYHYAEGPGDLRIRTTDRKLLDRILGLIAKPSHYIAGPMQADGTADAIPVYDRKTEVRRIVEEGFGVDNLGRKIPAEIHGIPDDAMRNAGEELDAVEAVDREQDKISEEPFGTIMLAYMMGSRWALLNGATSGVSKAAYDYADKATSPIK